MAQPIISAENIGKRYRLQHQAKQPYSTLRDTLTAQAKRLFGGSSVTDDSHADSHDEFWALKEVNFEIQRGDVVGIIGRNGAGKSTLLKVLSRIVEPTTGRITLRGRVASLLEVGTGFHPELTGRENIFLNGAILGMSKSEIRSRFDEIVAFAEVERFLDTPVKRYSSGMYVRLAFAVAAHLEPEILIVDEVLAVGDAQFQKKCLGKLKDVAKGGRTVLVVSHDINTVRKLCTKAILLSKGTLQSYGDVESTVHEYADSAAPLFSNQSGTWETPHAGPGVRSVTVMQDGGARHAIKCGYPFTIRVDLELDHSCHDLELGLGFKDANGGDIIRLNNKHIGQPIEWPQAGRLSIEIRLPSLPWIEGASVALSIYFGYIGDSYQTLNDILPIQLTKIFGVFAADKIVPGVNKIFIDGITFSHGPTKLKL